MYDLFGQTAISCLCSLIVKYHYLLNVISVSGCFCRNNLSLFSQRQVLEYFIWCKSLLNRSLICLGCASGFRSTYWTKNINVLSSTNPVTGVSVRKHSKNQKHFVPSDYISVSCTFMMSQCTTVSVRFHIVN